MKDIQSKIEKVINKLGVSAQALVSTGKGKYRKPFTGMWDFFLSEVRNLFFVLTFFFRVSINENGFKFLILFVNSFCEIILKCQNKFTLTKTCSTHIK